MRPALLLTLAAVLAGCMTAEPATTPAATSSKTPLPAGPIVEDTDCRAINAFGTVDEAELAPFVPENWTFTTATPGRGILRMFTIVCAERSTTILATPMVPDEASAAHHDNPDHVIEIFTSDTAAVERWTAAGMVARPATITQSLAPPFDTLLVETEAGTAMQLDLLPVGAPGTRGYEWQAVYSGGTGDAIAWFWGDEVSPSLTITRFQVSFGAGSALGGAQVQTNFAQRWSTMDVAYNGGLPSGS